MEFVAIDFETANSERSSICSVGIVTVKDGLIVNEFYHLVKPPLGDYECLEDCFDDYNIQIHGITPKMVKNEPTFVELWNVILPLLENKMVIAHNAAFDVSCLRHVLDVCGLPYPNFEYLCTWKLAKSAFPKKICYKLDFLCHELGFEFKHHNALEDAKACAFLFNEITKKCNANDFATIAINNQVVCGKLYADGYNPCRVKSTPKPKLSFTPNLNADPEHYFYGKNITFTGAMFMKRATACNLVAEKGGNPLENVTKKTNILVFGVQDKNKLAPGSDKSRKQAKAEEYLEAGQEIEIIDEIDFYNFLDE